MTLALEFARRARTLVFDDLPPQALHRARIGMLDTVGDTLAGNINQTRGQATA